jgi:hypothetical protein
MAGHCTRRKKAGCYSPGVSRPRKSRIGSSLTLLGEELSRVEQVVDELRAELRQLGRRVARMHPVGRTPAKAGRPRSRRACSVRGCEQPHVARGLCKNHYQQLRYSERKQP